MKNKDYVDRLALAFDGERVSDVAHRLGVPHATARNYFLGRLPSADVLIKMAKETGVSLNWLLLGTGDMYVAGKPPIGIGRFLEEKIAEMIEQQVAKATGPAAADGNAD